MPPKPSKKRDRVAGKMTLKEFMYRHTPLDAPSNEFKDEMAIKDEFHIGQPLALDDLQVSPEQSKLRESVLNTNLDEMLREIDVLLHSSGSNKPNLKWVDALDQLYHDFLHRSKVQSPIYPGSPSPLSSISVNSQLGKRQRPNMTRSNRYPQIMVNQWVDEWKPAAPTRNDLQNPQQTQISPPRHMRKQTQNNRRPLSASDIHRLTAKKQRRSRSSSIGSTSSKGSLHLSEFN